MLPDIVSLLLNGTGLVSIIGAVAMFIRTRQRGKLIEANVIERLGGTVGDFAESVRRDAQATIDSIRQDARIQIDASAARADAAEARAGRAEERASAAWNAVLDIKRELLNERAAHRSLVSAIWSPYATLDGLKAMAPQQLNGS